MVNVPEAAGRGAGGFLGGLFNNPGIVILGGLAIALAFFSGDIRKAFGSLGESLSGIGDIKLPDITLPTINFPEITFPSLPDITLPSLPTIFGGGETPPGGIIPGTEPPELQPGEIPSEALPGLTIPPGCTVNPDGTISCPTPPTFDAGPIIGGDVPQTPVPEGPDLFTPGGINIGPFLGLPSQPEPEPIPLPEPISPITGFGGPSFEGGTIFATPIANLSLSQIIEQFDVTASQAANLLAIAEGFTPQEEAFLGQQGTIGGISIIEPTGPAVSDPSVAGLSPEAIFAQLFGNVQNPDF